MKKLLLSLLPLVFGANIACAEDIPTVRLEAKDGIFKPVRLAVPAGKRVMIEIHNIGRTPIEFESTELRKEKSLSPGSSSFVVVSPLSPGEYKFFDDFHPNSGKGVIVAK